MLELRYQFWRRVHDALERAWHWSWYRHLEALAVKTGRLEREMPRGRPRYEVIYSYRSRLEPRGKPQ